jgi:hypothetical protein
MGLVVDPLLLGMFFDLSGNHHLGLGVMALFAAIAAFSGSSGSADIHSPRPKHHQTRKA